MEYSSRHIILWASIPCTGGSPWQYVNEAMYYRNGDQKALRRLKGHRTLFRKLFWTFRRLANEVLKLGGTVCTEWPTPCQYWRDPEVKKFMTENNMMKANLHGCAYGLKNSKGKYMKKPWSIASNAKLMVEGIARKCDGNTQTCHCTWA